MQSFTSIAPVMVLALVSGPLRWWQQIKSAGFRAKWPHAGCWVKIPWNCRPPISSQLRYSVCNGPTQTKALSISAVLSEYDAFWWWSTRGYRHKITQKSFKKTQFHHLKPHGAWRHGQVPMNLAFCLQKSCLQQRQDFEVYEPSEFRFSKPWEVWGFSFGRPPRQLPHCRHEEKVKRCSLHQTS